MFLLKYSKRLVIWLFFLFIHFIGITIWSVTRFDSILTFLTGLSLVTIGLFGIIKFWPSHVKTTWFFITYLVLSRVVLLSFPESDDVYRYIWEGKIQHYGFNPFLEPPQSPKTVHLRDSLFSSINHKEVTSTYGPLAQLVFKASSAVSTTPLFFKIVFLLFDLLTVFLIYKLLKYLAVSSRYVAFYALHPVVLFQTAARGHLEVAMVFFITVLLYAVVVKKLKLGAFGLGCAVAIKPTTVFFAPLLFHPKSRFSPLLFFFLAPLFLSFFYFPGILKMFDTTATFANEFHYNGFFTSIFSQFFNYPDAITVSWTLFIVIAAYVFFFTPDLIRSMFTLYGAFLLCSSTVHPWYFLPMIPFLTIIKSIPWTILSCTIMLSTITELNSIKTGIWSESHLIWWFEYIPFIIAAIYSVSKGHLFTYKSFLPHKNFSIIIPVLNEINRIPSCIQSVEVQDVKVQIVIVDAGSTDGTREWIRSKGNLTLVDSTRGRGVQINRGLQHCNGNTIIVLHADSQLANGALQKLQKVLHRNPGIAGGAFGASYRTPTLRYQFIAVLNTMRAYFTGIGFGDQAQFFRIDAIQGGFPDQLLMEDIELSLKLKESGSTVFIPGGVSNSARRWSKEGYLSNFGQVIYLTALYIIKRRFGLLKGKCEDFYRAYYGK